MNIKMRVKDALIKFMLNKRSLSGSFDLESAERFILPSDSDESQNNSYYFSGADLKGNSLLFRFAQRGTKKNEVWFAYKSEDGEAYINEVQLYTGEAPAGVKCVEPGKKWEFFYNGELKDNYSDKKITVVFRGEFTSSVPVFEFGHDVDPGVMAKAIARQKWNRKFFDELQGNDQTHYEQSGKITGTLKLGEKEIDISLPAIRDHSYGKRDWNYMNRHFWLMSLFEDGSNLNANMVSYPVLELETGYCVSGGKTLCVESAEVIGDVVPKIVPESFILRVGLTDGRSFDVSCKKETQFDFPFEGGVYTIYEGVGSFETGGKKGRGILEFGWNGDASRHSNEARK